MSTEAPYNEAWWERELHRNEKLMDRYLAALADNPDLAKPRHPEAERRSDPVDLGVPSGVDGADIDGLDELLLESSTDGEDAAEDSVDTAENGLEDCPPDNEGYADVARFARRFAVAIGSLESSKELPEILKLSAPKVGANLAGGHGLGYDEETLCGNIVKCRWALADCEFCREMLEQLAERTGRGIYRSLAEQCRQLAGHIRDRIARLRERVWW
jgi:hypothetical protein